MILPLSPKSIYSIPRAAAATQQPSFGWSGYFLLGADPEAEHVDLGQAPLLETFI